MAKPFRGVINVDVTQSVPDWEPYTQPIAPEGTPNVLYIVLDDVGYSATRCRSSSRPNRCRPAARSCQPPSSARVTACPPRAP